MRTCFHDYEKTLPRHGREKPMVKHPDWMRKNSQDTAAKNPMINIPTGCERTAKTRLQISDEANNKKLSKTRQATNRRNIPIGCQIVYQKNSQDTVAREHLIDANCRSCNARFANRYSDETQTASELCKLDEVIWVVWRRWHSKLKT